ncbi:hypothetical protein ACFS5N_09355 [Mucilaginibacter ximonensis]|uniref:Addiction module component n=1 Tax=Mucilaginibacter ximonensis TaxID=538021 RepID=A0ABW5YBI7_9SPHI
MTVIELKEKIRAQIDSIDDEKTLASISRNIELEMEHENGVYPLNAEQIAAIEDGLQQIANGQWISHEDVTKEIEEWLKK